MIMHGPMLQGSVHNSWKLKTSQFLHGQHTHWTCHPLSMFGMLWNVIYDSVFQSLFQQTFEGMSDGITGLVGLALSPVRIPPRLPRFCPPLTPPASPFCAGSISRRGRGLRVWLQQQTEALFSVVTGESLCLYIHFQKALVIVDVFQSVYLMI